MLQKIEDGRLVRIFIGEGDRLHRRPLYEVIMMKAREMGLAGTTVTRGIAGYGAQSVVHSSRLLRISEDLPIVIEIVESYERVQAFVEQVDAMLAETDCGALITLEKTEILRHRAASEPPADV